MMRIILLLLVTLTGPFCTFTQASTLVAPTTTVLTPAANTVTDALAVKDTTMETVHQDAVSTLQPASGATEVSALTEVTMVSTAAPVTESEAKLETTAPTDKTQATEAGPEETTDAEATAIIEKSSVKETENPESDKDEAMGTGQLVGIVIGALIVVIVVIAVIILVVRRMGQYSP